MGLKGMIKMNKVYEIITSKIIEGLQNKKNLVKGMDYPAAKKCDNKKTLQRNKSSPLVFKELRKPLLSDIQTSTTIKGIREARRESNHNNILEN